MVSPKGGDNVHFAMTFHQNPFRFVLIALSGWMNGRQLLLIDYLREENRVLREQLGEKRLRFTDDQRRRLATKAKGLGRKGFRCKVLKCRQGALTNGVRVENSCVSGGDIEQGGNKVGLADSITLGQPPDSTLVDHVHGFDSLQRSPRALK